MSYLGEWLGLVVACKSYLNSNQLPNSELVELLLGKY